MTTTGLFIFLADKVAQMSARNKVIVTKEDDAVSTQTINMEELVPCSHEEADTRIIVHARHAVRHGSKAIMIKASDTDVLVIAVSLLPYVQQSGLQQLWVSSAARMRMQTRGSRIFNVMQNIDSYLMKTLSLYSLCSCWRPQSTGMKHWVATRSRTLKHSWTILRRTLVNRLSTTFLKRNLSSRGRSDRGRKRVTI